MIRYEKPKVLATENQAPLVNEKFRPNMVIFNKKNRYCVVCGMFDNKYIKNNIIFDIEKIIWIMANHFTILKNVNTNLTYLSLL